MTEQVRKRPRIDVTLSKEAMRALRRFAKERKQRVSQVVDALLLAEVKRHA